MRNDISELKEDLSNLQEWASSMPTQIGNAYLNFFLDRFDEQGWRDGGTLQKWKARSNRDKKLQKRALLVQSGRLRRSIRMKPVGNRIVFSSDAPYAKIHNEGGTVKARVSVRSHVRRRRGRTEKVSSHARNVNTKMPKRQFMGRSAFAEQIIIKQIERQLDKHFK